MIVYNLTLIWIDGEVTVVVFVVMARRETKSILRQPLCKHLFEDETRDSNLYGKVNLMLWLLIWGTLVLDLCITFVQINCMYPMRVNHKLYRSVFNYHAISLEKVSGYMPYRSDFIFSRLISGASLIFLIILNEMFFGNNTYYTIFFVIFFKCFSDCY